MLTYCRTALDRSHRFAAPVLILAATLVPSASMAADLSCEGLVPTGSTMICPGFEPNWAVELACNGTMTATFIDAFSGDTIERTTGTVTFSSQNPWTFQTSHGVAGSIAYTPGSCEDEANIIYDFTFTPTAAPGLSASFLFPFCCRIE